MDCIKTLKTKKMKKILIVLLAFALYSCSSSDSQMKQDEINSKNSSQANEASVAPVIGQKVSNSEATENASNEGGVTKITSADFKKLIFDYEKNKEWKFVGKRPCVVDFYADWCGPCKMIAPRLEELSREFAGKVDFYKVNTDEQRELSGVFQIRGIPAILFCPAEGQPQMSTGAMSKDEYKRIIEDFLVK